MMPDNLEDEIRENAAGPAKASDIVGSVEKHKLQDQIAADKHLIGKKAETKPHRGLRFNRITERNIPDNTGDDWFERI